MTYPTHSWCQFDHVCVDCGASKENVARGISPADCTWPPPGCEEADPRDGTWGWSIPQTRLTDDDKRRLAAGELPEWVHE